MDTYSLFTVPHIYPFTADYWVGMRFHLWLILRKIKHNAAGLIFCSQKTYSEKSRFILCNYRVNNEILQCFLRIINVETRSDRIKNIIHDINIQNYLEVAETLNQASEEINNYLIVKDVLNQAYTEYDEDGLNDLLMRHEKYYEKLKAMRIEERIKDCSVIGMTLDAYIGRFSNIRINFTIIFLDEAGYVPLIKALTLFLHGCGITLLGDHKQLPPVCEFDDINTIPGFYRLLWAKPSIFAETILHKDEEECLYIADNTDCPEFNHTKKSILTESHRFGVNLSNLLERLIYN
ncbi:MAG: hypothetical protein MIO92_06925 [Methanosarcinaceae archaeon]|nr:hypothetical protein [Methanosarcinaceae archaeon]